MKNRHPCRHSRSLRAPKAVRRRRERRHAAELRDRELEFIMNYGGNGAGWAVIDGVWWLLAKTVGGAVGLVCKAVRRARVEAVGRALAAVGLPTPAELTARWKLHPRKKLAEALLLGAMLMRISATLDSSACAAGSGRLAGRRGGLKAWLAENCPEIPYSTACRYRLLASRLAELLAMTGEASGTAMEWILPGQPLPRSFSPEERAGLAKLQDFVARLMEFHPSQAALGRLLAKELAAKKVA